tara:strand:+ start:6287 stop:6553 length:267 start_codon:yes stop_codon:yes gene_type:complete
MLGLIFDLYKRYPKIAKLLYSNGHTILKIYPGGVRDDFFKLIYHGYIPRLVLNPIAALISSKIIIHPITGENKKFIIFFIIGLFLRVN